MGPETIAAALGPLALGPPNRRTLNQRVVARKLIAEAGGLKPSALTAAHVRAVEATWKDRRPYTRLTYQHALVRLLKGLKSELVSTVTRTPPPDPRTQLVMEKQKRELLQHARPHVRLGLLLAMELGLRSGTIVKLAPAHIHQERQTFRFDTKMGRGQELPITPAIAEMLRLVPKTPADCQTPLLQLMYGRPCGQAALEKEWRSLRAKLAIPKDRVLHDLRRTLATNLFEAGTDLRTLQAILGHKELRTTFHYLNHNNTSLDQKRSALKERTS